MRGASVRITKALDEILSPRKKVIGKAMKNVMEEMRGKIMEL